MKLKVLFDQTKALWPDAFVLQPKSESNVAYWPLVHHHERIEEALDINDNWMLLGSWTFFQAMADCADQKACDGIFKVRSEDVSIDNFRALLLDNINTPQWENELKIFLLSNAENS
jgi:hypothetical protein